MALVTVVSANDPNIVTSDSSLANTIPDDLSPQAKSDLLVSVESMLVQVNASLASVKKQKQYAAMQRTIISTGTYAATTTVAANTKTATTVPKSLSMIIPAIASVVAPISALQRINAYHVGMLSIIQNELDLTYTTLLTSLRQLNYLKSQLV